MAHGTSARLFYTIVVYQYSDSIIHLNTTTAPILHMIINIHNFNIIVSSIIIAITPLSSEDCSCGITRFSVVLCVCQQRESTTGQ